MTGRETCSWKNLDAEKAGEGVRFFLNFGYNQLKAGISACLFLIVHFSRLGICGII